MKKNKKCPRCNSTKTRQHPKEFVCLNCGYKNKPYSQIEISTNWSSIHKENSTFEDPTPQSLYNQSNSKV